MLIQIFKPTPNSIHLWLCKNRHFDTYYQSATCNETLKIYTHKANQYFVAPAEAVAEAPVVVVVVVVLAVVVVLEAFDDDEVVVLAARHCQ